MLDLGFNVTDFLYKLGIGSVILMVNLGIQMFAIDQLLAHFRRRRLKDRNDIGTSRGDFKVLAIMMGFLFAGHLLQFATWAFVFMAIGEFEDFGTAFYHSTVNFTSLGYGDIVMSESWRLLGALEAANGVLMFGLTAGLVVAVLGKLIEFHPRGQEFLKRQGSPDRDVD